MIRKFVLPLVAVAGVLFAVYTVIKGGQPVTPAEPVAQPSRAPFATYVAGAGIVEASTENIAIGTPIGNVVTDVYVKVGDRVKQGDPLFKLRDSIVLAELEMAKAAHAAAKAKLERLRSLPRPEDVPPAQARVTEAEANVADQRNQLRLYESVTDRRAVSEDEITKRRFAVKAAEAKLAAAQAELDLLKAGTWKSDLLVAEADVASAAAAVQQVEAELNQRTVRAPVEGTVLQVKIRPGEYAQPGPLVTPLMLLGNIDVLAVRVDVDENDAWRVSADADATAYVRGNAGLKTPLKFVRIEPYVIPKRSLTGESTERVDTRVLQILYSFERGKLPIYVGQQMDVFVEAPPVSGATTRAAAK